MTTLKDVEALWEKVCFDPNYVPQGRYQTYRDLVFEGMLDVLQSICPVASDILSPEEWQETFWHFLREAPPKTVVIRRLPYEASQYLRLHQHPLQEKYPWLGELMEYEYLEVGVRFASEDNVNPEPGKLKLNPAHALGQYSWPVHFIDADHWASDQLPQGDYFLFLWREPKDLEVKFMEVNPLVAILIEKLKSSPQNEGDLLNAVAKQMSLSASDKYLSEGRALIEDFIKQGILIA